MRLIDAAPVEEQLDNLVKSTTGRSMAVIGYTNAHAMIIAAPTVDAVVPVRCLNCKHWGPRLEEEGTGLCWVNGPGWLLVKRAEEYCSSGKHREKGDPAPAFPAHK